MERPKDQCPARLHATEELLPPYKEDGHTQGHLFCLSLSFLPLYHECNPSPPLRSYKMGGRATSRVMDEGIEKRIERLNNLEIK
jgi:hypothetical protein